MADWATIASLATAGGTLVLAVATFSSVRSANRTARIAERSMLLGLRPVLVPSRDQDPVQEVVYGDGHVVHLPPGVALVEEADGDLYLTLGLRNAGAGLAVLQARSSRPASAPVIPTATRRTSDGCSATSTYRRGTWASGRRRSARATRTTAGPACAKPWASAGRSPSILLYGDFEGGQSTVSRFGLFPPEEGEAWLLSVGRHWSLDGSDPR